MPTVDTIIQLAEVSQYQAIKNIDSGGFSGGGITIDLATKLYCIRKSIENRYNLDSSDLTLITTSNYLYSLCLASAQGVVLTSGGVVVPGTGQSGYKYTELSIAVNGASGSPVFNQYTYSNVNLVGATDLSYIIVNNVTETVGNGDFTFNSATGTITRINPWQVNDTCVIPFNQLV